MRKLLISLMVFFSFTSLAYAHAYVESSEPKKGEVLDSSPASVKVRFSEALRLDESTLSVLDANHKAVSGLIITKTGDNNVLNYTLPKLDSGTYTVKWHAVCLCTDHHATNGSFTFTVK